MNTNTNGRHKDVDGRHSLDFISKGSLMHLSVQNEVILRALSGRRLQHIRLQNGNTTDFLANIFLDFNGAHAIVSTTTGKNFYLNMRSAQWQPLKRFKGTITAFGWNMDFSREIATGFIVFGTNKGQPIKADISANGTMAYLKTLVNDAIEDKAFVVTELQMHHKSEETIHSYAAAAELRAQLTEPFENTAPMFLRDGTSKERQNGLKRFPQPNFNPMNPSEMAHPVLD
ncbi:Protein VPS-18 [Aphelenchoides avenae]|nr:Protein VPS-18 [Aphelenchus avenae]